MAQKGVPVSFRLLPEVKAALDAAAKADHRSVSSLLDKLVTDWPRRKRALPQGMRRADDFAPRILGNGRQIGQALAMRD